MGRIFEQLRPTAVGACGVEGSMLKAILRNKRVPRVLIDWRAREARLRLRLNGFSCGARP